MERRIKDYEKYIEKAAKHPTAELKQYHSEMLRNFQHERAMHLAVMLFFVAVTLVFIAIAVCGAFFIRDLLFMILASIIAALLFITTVFYVRHYYFLENHIQKLYDISTKLYENNSKK